MRDVKLAQPRYVGEREDVIWTKPVEREIEHLEPWEPARRYLDLCGSLEKA